MWGIKEFFQQSYALEFDSNPEIPNFNKIVMYVKGEDESFDDDWEEIKKVNKEIKSLSHCGDLLSVDLW